MWIAIMGAHFQRNLLWLLWCWTHSERNQKFTGNKNAIHIHIIQARDSIMYGYFCIGFIGFMLKGKSLLGYTKLFFLKEYEKNDKLILKYFQLNKKIKLKKSIGYL